MSTTQNRPYTSSSVPAKEGSLYEGLARQADTNIVTKAVDTYLRKAKETGSEYESRVHSLREIFSTPEKIKELKSRSSAAIYLSTSLYSPTIAR